MLVAGFGMYLRDLPPPNASTEPADAIIVLTGSNQRVEHGFEQLYAGIAPKMFISGVYDKATREHVFHSFSTISHERYEAMKSRIDLGYEAETTAGNAIEIARWVAKQNPPIHRVRIVTAQYHMPRALCELRRTMPKVELIADPAFPIPFDRADWWKTRMGAFRATSEYLKMIYAYLRPLLPESARLDRLPRAMRFDKDIYRFDNN